MSWKVDTDITSNVTTNKTDSRNLSTTSSSADTSTTDNSDRSNRSNTNIGTGDNSKKSTFSSHDDSQHNVSSTFQKKRIEANTTNIGTGDNSRKSTFSSHDDSQHNVSSTIQKERIEANTTNIGTGDNSSRTQNRSEIRSDRNEVKHDTRISTADSSIHYNMASNSVINIHSQQGVPPLQVVTPPQSAATPMAVKQLPAMPESTNTGIFGFFGALIPKKKPAEVVSEPFDESLIKPQIIESNMNEDMKDEIKGVLYLAHEKSGNTKDRGIFIREKLNTKYSHEWHCIIGTELDGCCMGQDGHFMQLKYKGHTYVIFKTPSPQLQVDLENLENKAAYLSKKYEEMENKVSSLELQNNNLKKENSEIEVEKTNLNKNITNLNEQLNEYMKKEKNQEDKIAEIQKENQNLLTEKYDVENKNSELIDENKNLSAQNESMKKELEEAKPILEKLKNEEIVEAFRRKENLKDDKKSIMREACQYGDIEVVRALLDLGYVGVNDRIEGSNTGLIEAVAYNRANVVSLLLDRGADVNLKETLFDGWTPLMYAAYFGSLESAKLLVTRGADKTLRTNYTKRTALGIVRDAERITFRFIFIFVPKGDRGKMIDYLVSVGVPE